MAKPYLQMVLLVFLMISTPIASCKSNLPDAIGDQARCRASSVRIYQWLSGYTALHVPKFTVQVVNEAWRDAAVFDVRVWCGEFASFCLVNPFVFRRAGFHVCLLKNGRKLSPGEVIYFQYANIVPYDLRVIHLRCQESKLEKH